MPFINLLNGNVYIYHHISSFILYPLVACLWIFKSKIVITIGIWGLNRRDGEILSAVQDLLDKEENNRSIYL